MLKKDFEFRKFDDSTYFGTTGDIEIGERWDCCFGEFTKHCPKEVLSQSFTITLWKLQSGKMTEYGHNNVCLFNKREIEKHLEEIQQVHPFDYEVTPYKDKYKVRIDIQAHALYIKFVLTWVRLLYEFPHNVLYRDALTLQKLPSFDNMNLLSIYNLVCSTMSNTAHAGYESGFIYPYRFTEPITYEELKNRIEDFIKEDKYWINQLFTITDNEGSILLPDLYYDSYSWHIYDIFYGRIPRRAVKDQYKQYYNTGHSANVFYYPDNGKFIRFETDHYVDQHKYWTSIRKYNHRLKAYLKNLKILNDYLKDKK